jgi:hypothetical protein
MEVLPTPADLVRFGVREVYTPDIVRKFGQLEDFPEDIVADAGRIGMSRETMLKYWAAHWDLPSPGQGYEMRHRGLISDDDLMMLLRALDVMPFWRQKLFDISHRIIPRRTIPRLIKNKVIDSDIAFGLFRSLGYSPQHSKYLTQDAMIAAEEEGRKLTKAELENGYINGWIDKIRFQQYLRELGYGTEEILYYMQRAESRKITAERSIEVAELREHAKEAKTLTKGEVLRAYRLGTLDIETARRYLRTIGYAAETVDHLLTMEGVKSTVDYMEEQAKQIRRMYMAGGIDRMQAEARLANVGYMPDQTRRMTNLWETERRADLVVQEASPTLPSLSDLRDWLTSGIIGGDQWVEYMRQRGYADDTIAHYLEEIILQTTE